MDVYSGPRKHQCAKIKPAFMLVSKTTHKQHSIGEIHTDTRRAGGGVGGGGTGAKRPTFIKRSEQKCLELQFKGYITTNTIKSAV